MPKKTNHPKIDPFSSNDMIDQIRNERSHNDGFVKHKPINPIDVIDSMPDAIKNEINNNRMVKPETIDKVEKDGQIDRLTYRDIDLLVGYNHIDKKDVLAIKQALMNAKIRQAQKQSTQNSQNGQNGQYNQNPQNSQNRQYGRQYQNQRSNQPVTPEALGLVDYREKAEAGMFEHVKFREDVKENMLMALSSLNHPNALLVGEAGVGKTAIVEDLALSIYEQDPIVLATIGNAHIYELPLANLVAGTSLVGMLETRLNQIIDFCTDPNNKVILFIDEIHQLTGKNANSTISETLKPALARGDMHLIGATTTQELKDLKTNPAFKRRFTQISVPELTDEQTIELLTDRKKKFEDGHNVIIPNDILPYVVSTADKLAKVLDTHRPDSAQTVLDEASAAGNMNRAKLGSNSQEMTYVTKSLVDKVAINVLKTNAKLDRTAVLNCKKILDDNLVGQDLAKKAIIKTLKSEALGLETNSKPKSFLFAGPSGTGKTEAAKLLAQGLFGDKDKLVYINMSEYATAGSITRLIGSSAGFIGSDSKQPLPLDILKTNPCQVVLLDEFEKADKNVQRLFMQALDEGYIRDSHDSYIDFSHAYVIATTNAGLAELNESHVGFSQPSVPNQLETTKILSQYLPPELVNRFGSVVMFTPISKDEYKQILVLSYNNLIKHAMINRPDLGLTPSKMMTDSDFINRLAKNFDPMKGGRPAKQAVKDEVEKQIYEQFDQDQIVIK